MRRSVPRGENPFPRQCPCRAESSWKHPQFTPPLRTFFTVDSAADIRGLGSATIAPGGLDVYSRATAFPRGGTRCWHSAWSAGRSTGCRWRQMAAASQGTPIELFQTANRYRDIAIDPDGRTIYLATDPTGPYRNAGGTVVQTLANPASILAFTTLMD